MSIFDINNPRHKQILKEELARAKRLVEQSYNADEIWKTMNPEERQTALYVAKEPNPDALLNVEWDDIPDDVQDLIDLGDFQLASKDSAGRTTLRGIDHLIKTYPKISGMIEKFLKRIGRASINDLTVSQAYKLSVALFDYLAPDASQSNNKDIRFDTNPNAINPSKGYMGKSYTGD